MSVCPLITQSGRAARFLVDDLNLSDDVGFWRGLRMEALNCDRSKSEARGKSGIADFVLFVPRR